MSYTQTLQLKLNEQLASANRSLEFWRGMQDEANEQYEAWSNIIAELLEIQADPEAVAS